MDRGWCITAVTGRGQYVDDKHPLLDGNGKPVLSPEKKPYTWWDLRPLMVQIPYFDYVEIRKWITIQCRQSGQCDSRISSWDRTLENLDKVIIQK